MGWGAIAGAVLSFVFGGGSRRGAEVDYSFQRMEYLANSLLYDRLHADLKSYAGWQIEEVARQANSQTAFLAGIVTPPAATESFHGWYEDTFKPQIEHRETPRAGPSLEDVATAVFGSPVRDGPREPTAAEDGDLPEATPASLRTLVGGLTRAAANPTDIPTLLGSQLDEFRLRDEDIQLREAELGLQDQALNIRGRDISQQERALDLKGQDIGQRGRRLDLQTQDIGLRERTLGLESQQRQAGFQNQLVKLRRSKSIEAISGNIHHRNAREAARLGREATDAGARRVWLHEYATRQSLGEREAKQAASGVIAGSGSALQVRKGMELYAAMQALDIRRRTASEALAYAHTSMVELERAEQSAQREGTYEASIDHVQTLRGLEQQLTATARGRLGVERGGVDVARDRLGIELAGIDVARDRLDLQREGIGVAREELGVQRDRLGVARGLNENARERLVYVTANEVYNTHHAARTKGCELTHSAITNLMRLQHQGDTARLRAERTDAQARAADAQSDFTQAAALVNLAGGIYDLWQGSD